METFFSFRVLWCCDNAILIKGEKMRKHILPNIIIRCITEPNTKMHLTCGSPFFSRGSFSVYVLYSKKQAAWRTQIKSEKRALFSFHNYTTTSTTQIKSETNEQKKRIWRSGNRKTGKRALNGICFMKKLWWVVWAMLITHNP